MVFWYPFYNVNLEIQGIQIHARTLNYDKNRDIEPLNTYFLLRVVGFIVTFYFIAKQSYGLMGFHHLYSHRGCNQRCNLALHNNPTNLHLLLINPDGLIPTRHKNLQDYDISSDIICQNNFWNYVSSNLLRTPNHVSNKPNFTLNSNNGILAKHLTYLYDYFVGTPHQI